MTGVTSACRRSEPAPGVSWCLVLSLTIAACGGTLDAGHDEPRGLLPVDNRNPIVLCNDGYSDNWFGEYAMLFANAGILSVAGLVISTGPNESTDLATNMAGWRQMVAAAQQSGLQNIPDPMASTGPVLVSPSDGAIDSTVPNRSEGARFIIDTSLQLSRSFRPLVVVTAGRLTDLADAYLMDHTVPDRVVVVSMLGSVTSDGAKMGVPNGELDPWADTIVAQKYRYVQVSAFYDQISDVSDSLVPQLPTNSFTTWIQDKQSRIYDDIYAADQVAVAAVAIPDFVSSVTRVVEQVQSSGSTPLLSNDPNGSTWLVSQINSALATAYFWQMLLDPATFHPQ